MRVSYNSPKLINKRNNMAKQVTISEDGVEGHTQYHMVKTIEDLDYMPHCFAPREDLIKCIEEGRTILINRMGGYCFLEDCHTIVPE